MAKLLLTHESPGAPTLLGARNSILGVLDWALPQKGWEIYRTATDARVYRMGGGSRRCLYIDATGTAPAITNNGMISARGCGDATAANFSSLINPFPKLEIRSGSSYNFPTKSVALSSFDSVANKFQIHLEDNFVQFHLGVATTTSLQLPSDYSWWVWSFGDLANEFYEDDTNSTIITGFSATSSQNTTAFGPSTFGSSFNASNIFWYANYEGTDYATYGLTSTVSSGNSNIRDNIGNWIWLGPVHTEDSGSSTSTSGTAAGILNRGYLPWVARAFHNNNAVNLQREDTFTVDIAGNEATFMLLGTTSQILFVEQTDFLRKGVAF